MVYLLNPYLPDEKRERLAIGLTEGPDSLNVENGNLISLPCFFHILQD